MMKTVFTVLYVVASSYAAPPKTNEDLTDSRIVGGLTAADGSYTYQASLRDENNNHFCGGVIITTRTVLTAAHCISGRTTSNTWAYVGTNNIQTGTRYGASLLKVHAEFNPKSYVNDVAVFITNLAIVFNPRVQPIGLNYAQIGGGETVILTGWGLTSNPGSPSKNLQVITLKTITLQDCRIRIGSIGNIFDSSLCTLTKVGESGCMGDSGGPLVAGGKLIGIVSWGLPCARGYPDVYARVSFYTSWIKSNAI